MAREAIEPHSSAAIRALVLAVGLTMASALPMFLTAALAVQIKADLGFSSTGLGWALGSFLMVAGFTSAKAGRLTDRIGWDRTALLALGISTLALAGIATLGRSHASLIAFLCIGGTGQAIGQTTGNALLASESPLARSGVHFGVKQSAIPIAGLLSGLAVPTIALTLGWRWAFVAGITIPMLVGVFLLRSLRLVAVNPRRGEVVALERPSRSLVLLAAGLSLGSGAVGSLGFLAVGGVNAGLSPSGAGLLVAAASGAGLVGRIAFGWLVDRFRSDGFRLVAVLLAIGSIGFLALAVQRPMALVVGAVVAYCAGWGWPGVVLHGVVSHHRQTPGAATGIIGVGTAGGAAIGPIIFGLIVDVASFPVAWSTSALLAVLSSIIVAHATRRFVVHRSP